MLTCLGLGPAGTCVLRVPRRLLLSVESARRDAELAAALQHCTASGVMLTSEQVGMAGRLPLIGKAPVQHPVAPSNGCPAPTQQKPSA